MTQIAIDKKKLLGQVYSSDFIVNKILDDVGFNSKIILGKSIIDMSCGDGAFLKEIVARIIKYSEEKDLIENLKCVYGWDIDGEAIAMCIESLNDLIKPFEVKIKWNLYVKNSIQEIENFESKQKFDFIIGNPPYIRIHNIPIEQRTYLREKYFFCKKGGTDMYLAFLELAHKFLSDEGICGLITPNTYFYTEAGRNLRETLINNRLIKKISNFLHAQMFENVATYTAITIFTKKENKDFLYEEYNDKIPQEKTYLFEEFNDTLTWQLSLEKLKKIAVGGRMLKDICRIQVGLATLFDKIFIFDTEDIDNKYCYAVTKLSGKVKIEKSILKDIIKASKLKDSKQITTQSILFPYKKNEKGRYVAISEQEFKDKYPLSYEYLSSMKKELSARDKGKCKIKNWYEFGRSQGLDNSFGKKIVFSTMGAEPNFILCKDEDTTVYSGYFMKCDGNYNDLLDIINSKKMENFIAVSGRSFGGGWKSYSKKILERFPISEENYEKLKLNKK